jgi:spermidine/putrescine-binding protein
MKPTLVKSMLPVSERVAVAKGGAPLDYVRINRMLGDSHYAVLSNKTPRPSAGKAFIDYYLDDESMNTLDQSGEFAHRKGIYPPLPGAEKICRWKCSQRKRSRKRKGSSVKSS